MTMSVEQFYLLSFKPIGTSAWNSISSTGKDIGYLLSINDSTTTRGEIKLEDPLTNEYMFSGLSPADTPFLIRMRTFNSIGLSEMSVDTVEKTFESVPLRPPSNLRVDTINGSSARISWDALNSSDQGGSITHYKILYFPLSSVQSIHTVNHASMEFTLDHLDGYSNYSCAISACTSSGCSAFSEAVHLLTEEDVPSKPTEVFFPDVDHWSARMIWQRPTRVNGILTGYQLVYWRSDDEQTRIVIDNLTETSDSYLAESKFDAVDDDRRTIEDLDLEKTTPYTFILCAKTRLGCGEASVNRLLTVEKRGR
jgi:hypothetical protein